MSFDWSEYLALAQFLQNARNLSPTFSQEASYRCAVSRAYYAAFCHARNYAANKQAFLVGRGVEAHRLLRQHFRKSGMTRIAQQLEEMRQWRNQCDYQDTVGNIPKLLTSAIAHAQQVVNQLK